MLNAAIKQLKVSHEKDLAPSGSGVAELIHWLFVAVRKSGWWGAFYIALDGAVLALTLVFTLAIASYFGHDSTAGYGVWFAAKVGLSPEVFFGAIASITSLLGLSAKLGQTAVDARIVVSQEMRFAQNLKRSRIVGVAPGDLARASNHFGRLCAAAVKVMSATILLGVSFGTILMVVRGPWLAITVAAITGCILLAFGVFRILSRLISTASSDMVAHAKRTSLWKTGLSTDLAPVRAYLMAYFRRLFLVSVFGVAPLIFATVVSIGLLILSMTNFSIDLASAFIAFMMAQAYLGIVGRAFNNAMSIAAFLPAVLRAIERDGAAGIPLVMGEGGFEDDLSS